MTRELQFSDTTDRRLLIHQKWLRNVEIRSRQRDVRIERKQRDLEVQT